MNLILWSSIFSGILALIFAVFKSFNVLKKSSGTHKMIEVSQAIQSGSMAFLKCEYKILVYVVLIFAFFLMLFNLNHKIFMLQSVSFIVGAFLSGLSGFFGMKIATLSNVRTANAARYSLKKALDISFDGGTVMGMSVVGLGIIGISVLLLIYNSITVLQANNGMKNILVIISGFSMGASTIALFARVGGGIYTKAADIGADLVGKIEANIPEDDPRNPAVIADNVGDNVGDVAGMGADLFESYVGVIIASMIIGSTIIEVSNINIFIFLPLILASLGIVSSIIGTFGVYCSKNVSLQNSLNIGGYIANAMMVLGSYIIVFYMLPELYSISGSAIIYSKFGVFISIIAGLLGGIIIGLLTQYYCSKGYYPVCEIIKSTDTGVATSIISGLSLGMQSTALPIIVIVSITIVANYFAGLYGVAIAALGILSTTGIQLAVDAYGPIADNAGGIVEMSGLSAEARHRTDSLDAVGNTTAAIGKGFAIASAALTSFALFHAYQIQLAESSNTIIEHVILDISKPNVMCGVLLGAMLPFLFSSLAMQAVNKAALEMIKEVRRQFREIPGLKTFKSKPDYDRCINISTIAALKEMIKPGLMAVLIPIIIGFFDATGLMLGGLLIGAIASGVLLAIFMSNAGGLWDNAKKQIEENIEDKSSDRYIAAVVCDTVGDPFKDTAGPSLNILIKLMTIVALIIIPVFMRYGFHWF